MALPDARTGRDGAVENAMMFPSAPLGAGKGRPRLPHCRSMVPTLIHSLA